MRITAVKSRVEHFALTRPYAIAGESPVDTVDNVIVEVHTERGLVGRGAGSPAPRVTGESLERCSAALEPAALDWLVGRDLRQLRALCRELERRARAEPAARAALDIALHDVVAQAVGLPLCDLMGRAHQTLPTSITIGIRTLEQTLAEADEYLARGFRALKVKIGDDLASDVERLIRLREHIGPEIAIRVDANQGYSPQTTLSFWDRTAALDLELIEQPLPAAAAMELRALPDGLRARIAADESLCDERDALALAAPRPACGIFNIKLMKCGGIAAAQRIAAIAETAGVVLMWGCMDESVISIAAALHTALASPATRYLDLDGSFDLARDVASGGFVVRDGCLATTGMPGLGLTPG